MKCLAKEVETCADIGMCVCVWEGVGCTVILPSYAPEAARERVE